MELIITAVPGVSSKERERERKGRERKRRRSGRKGGRKETEGRRTERMEGVGVKGRGGKGG